MLVEENFEIIKYTTFKIGGKIQKIYFPQEIADANALPKNCFVIGNLSNTLISSSGTNIPVVSTSKLDYIKISGNTVIAGAGVKGPKLAQIAADEGLSGFEFMIGFPGTVGGEVYMNAGANGQTIADTFKSAKVYIPASKEIATLYKDDMEFDYRKSICQSKKYIILEAEFELKPENPDIIKQKMAENLEFRKTHQPSLSLPNCGSIFKNPKNNSAGKLLDECEVKNMKIGGAKVWENHANFIVNEGNASSTDVLKLMCEMKQRVKEKFNINLVPEIRYLGGKDEEEELLCTMLYQK